MDIWMSSDLHLGHTSILGFTERPWETLDEMHEAIINNWNSLVQPEDTVYILGDFAMGDRKIHVPLADRLNGHKILLCGNHENCWRGGKKNWETWLPLYEQHFEQIINMMPGEAYPFRLNDTLDVWLCHFPTSGDSRHEERYSAWRPQVDGWLLHGHTHSTEKIDYGLRQYHVGMDAHNYFPVRMETIIEDIQKGA